MKPVYPEILTPSNTLSVSGVNNGDGTATITIAENQEFLIQDVKISTSGRRDLSFTVPIPTTTGQIDTYHLRYSLNGRPINDFIPQKNSFYLVNVNDATYNPNELDETDETFDTTGDDVLVARVQIDSNGSLNIMSLKNKARLLLNIVLDGNVERTLETSSTVTVVPKLPLAPSTYTSIDSHVPIGWGRTPRSTIALQGFSSIMNWAANNSDFPVTVSLEEGNVSRYEASLLYRFADNTATHGSLRLVWRLEA